jgi:tRNA (guanine10-N2)-dimethyltransferase
MDYLFELSREHDTIPASEVLSCFKASNKEFKKVHQNANALIIKSSVELDEIKEIKNRLSHSFYIDLLLFKSKTSSLENIKKKCEKNQINKKGSIAIKYKNRSKNISSKKIIKVLAETYAIKRKVSLENPDIEVRALITDDYVYVGLKLFEINRGVFEERKVQFRPFFSPISLHPKVARALVNISEIDKNQTLLDPFCGTGGILIEAGLIGIKVIGSDVDKNMVQGCIKTLNHYKIKDYELFTSDVGNIKEHIKQVDAVVTDLPYGRATTTGGEEKKDLYLRSFKTISEILKKDSKAVIGIPDYKLINIGKRFLTLQKIHKIRVHRSLIRYFTVFCKQP